MYNFGLSECNRIYNFGISECNMIYKSGLSECNRSTNLSGKASFVMEAIRKSHQLFPLVKMPKEIEYPYTSSFTLQ